jgi:hypothetical protein
MRVWSVVAACGLAIAVVLGGILPMNLAGSAGPSSPYLVFAEGGARQLVAEVAGEVVNDYESFQLAMLTQGQRELLSSSGLLCQPYEEYYWIGTEPAAFDVREGQPSVPGLTAADAEQAGERYYLVKFDGPPQQAWIDSIAAEGAIIGDYVPFNSYICRMDIVEWAEVSTLPHVMWVGNFQPLYKVSPTLTSAVGQIRVQVTIHMYPDVPTAIDKIIGLGASGEFYYEQGQYAYAGFTIAAGRLPEVACLNDVRWMEFAAERPDTEDEVSAEIIGGAYSGVGSLVNSMGFNGSGTVVAVCDTGVDRGDDLANFHLDLRGRVDAVVDYAVPPTGGIDEDNHGTNCAGIAAGNGAIGTEFPAGYKYGHGMAPMAHIVVQNGIGAGTPWPPTNGWQQLTKDAVLNGADVMTNSWTDGGGAGAGYTANAALWDGFVRDANIATTGVYEPLVICFSAGNSGPNARTITAPKEAKNIFTVGATENNRPPQGADGDNINQMASFSSRGPCVDLRLKPEICAPGTWISSARSAFGTNALWGYIDSNYVWCGGTSQACPHIAGGSALFVQYFRQTYAGATPSMAMTKAALINGAVDMDNAGGTTYIPNNDEGWGRMYLPNVLNPPFVVKHEDQAVRFTASGQFQNYSYYVVNNTRPFKVTVTWSDAPGAGGANPALVNNLDLQATSPGGTTYYGNRFTNGWSATGGSFDTRNNTENVYIQTPQAGLWNVRVRATTIAGSGVPDQPGNDQDYAIVASGNLDKPPVVTVTDPNAPNVILSGLVNVQWTATDDRALPANPINIYYSPDGGLSWNPVASNLANTGAYSWNSASVADGVNGLIRVTCTDVSAQVGSDNSDNPFSVDNILNDQWHLQVQTSLAGFKDLDMKPVELADNSFATNITGLGNYQLGGMRYASATMASNVNVQGTWNFTVWGRVSAALASGYLFAKVHRYDGVTATQLFQSSLDNELVGAFTLYHQFSWTYAAPSATVPIGQRIVVEVWLNATSGAMISYPQNLATADFPITGTRTGTYVDTQTQNDGYEAITEVAGPYPYTIYFNNFETGSLSGWTLGGASNDWQIGTPGGLGTPPDPTSAYSGTYSIGNDLTGLGTYPGEYENSIATDSNYIYTPVINCLGYTGVRLQFMRFLGMESATYDHAYIEVSRAPGGPWTQVWSHTGGSFTDPGWTQMSYSIASVADNQAAVYVRFELGATDSSVTYCGWNIDDLTLIGNRTTSYLEHKWPIIVPSGKSPYNFRVDAYRTSSADNDNFVFAYSTDNSTFTDMVTVTATTDTDAYLSFALPTTLAGTVYIRVRDTDHTQGQNNLDIIWVDHMFIESTEGPPQLYMAYDFGAHQSFVRPAIGTATASTYCIPVVAGWNLVSVPLVPGNTNLPNVLTDSEGDTLWDRAMWCNPNTPTDPWKQYYASWPAAMVDLKTADERLGLWVYVTVVGNGYINVSGTLPTSTAIPLYAGWNLIGYPARVDTTYTVGQLKTATGATTVEGFSAGATYKTQILGNAYIMKRGEGYWVYVPTDTTWTVNW